MKHDPTQSIVDDIVEKVFFWAIPNSIKPNYFSYIRIISVPFIYYLLSIDQKVYALILFILSILTDLIDGALARKRDQVTDLGKLLDPIADKMLILTVLVYIGFEYLIVWVFAIFIAFEMVTVLGSALLGKFLGRPIGANVFGKIKMNLQCYSVILFLLGLILKNNTIILVSEYILGAALIFAVLAGLEQLRRRMKMWRNKRGV